MKWTFLARLSINILSIPLGTLIIYPCPTVPLLRIIQNKLNIKLMHCGSQLGTELACRECSALWCGAKLNWTKHNNLFIIMGISSLKFTI